MENCKYWTQQDILHIYKHQNDDPYSLDSLALRASMWGSGMSQNYHPVKFIPKEVKLVDGKFYVWTEKWKWVEVPFSHDVLWDQKRELGRVDDGDWEQYLGPYTINKEINENMKNTIKLNEAQLRQIITESVKRVLKEYGGISLSDYDNSDVRYNRFDGDEMTQLFQDDAQRDEDDMRFSPEYDEKELVLNNLLRMRNKGLITDDELNKMKDAVGV